MEPVNQQVEPQVMPFTVKLGVIQGHDSATGKSEQYVAIEFHSVNGVSVYFANKENCQQLANGLGQMIKNIKKVPVIPVYKEMPRG